ncbi:MAG: MarR family winged helix-turn-helix transcriptional regulator [Gaiellaceae bacterium]
MEEPLVRLLLMVTRLAVDELDEGLRAAGHPDLRPAHGFVLNGIGESGATATRLAGLLGMTKQGAAKLVESLVELGYVERERNAGDARSTLLMLSARGRELLRRAEEIQSRLEAEWAEAIGAPELGALRRGLEQVVRERHRRKRQEGELLPLRPIW